ncbi:DNA-binding SARP family transcriptional activator [Streptomyces sp. 3330]|uniref:AfsR/SARP family transcriptional regulator n=1 Tax=Streptomyces sp. 3330 TaxID=2817755 RepID=UPI0028662760|nr:AfsR/SARP family transcriptional regulator [Streptomyces sp. 3330]MDR6981024.1 DNA-binding SARP family transcriptional activator [Streptomyces sp. 3330]
MLKGPETTNDEVDSRAAGFGSPAGRRGGVYVIPGQRPAGGGETRRIAELEREVRELRRVNETLTRYFAKALDLDFPLPLPRAGRESRGRGDGAEGDADAVSRGAPSPSAGRAPARPRESPEVSAAGVELRVLGPVEAAVGGRAVDLGAPKQRAALALLVSQVGRPVSVDVMLEELWEGQPPPSAMTSLHAYVANLRRVLEPERAPRRPATVLRTRGRGYLLDSRAVQVDARRFGERATAGWQALDRGDLRRALDAFEAGLALWRGQAYAEVADTAQVAPERVRLEELRLSATEGRCAALIAVGAHEVAVSELAAFTRAHPLREYGCELLGLALYRAGRQADALAVLRSHHQRMARELGIDPSPSLRHLESEILRQAPGLG